MTMDILVTVVKSKFLVDGNNNVFRLSHGTKKQVKSGPTVDAARRLATNLRAIRNSR
jgi:hypothetical protein